MKFIKDIIQWFIHGRSQPTEGETAPDPVQQPEKGPKKAKAPSSKEILEDILKEARSNSVIEDIKSLETASKKFDQAREDLLRELKNLAPKRDSN